MDYIMAENAKPPSFETTSILDIMLTQLRLSVNLSRIAESLGVDLVPSHLNADMSQEERKIRIREVKFARMNIEKLGSSFSPEIDALHAAYIAGNINSDEFIN